MAIRLNHEAAAVFVPPSASNRKYGQQLVLQQQKFANDQRQGMQDRMYDQQREYRQTAYQLQKDQTDRFVDNQRMQEQQKFAEKMQKNTFDMQQQRDQQEALQRAQMISKQQEMQRAAQLKAQERADDEDAMRTGGYDPVTASELKKSYSLETKIDLDDGMDEAMRADAHRQNIERRRKLQEARVPVPSMADQANRNLSHYVPSLQRFATPEELQGLKQSDPNIEVHVFQDGKMLPGPTPKQGPMTAQDYYRADDAKFNKDLASKMAPLQDKVDDGTLTLEDGQSVRDLAWKQMQEDYDFKQKALGGGQPAQGGQPAMPPMQGQQPVAPPAPVEQPPVLGMQDLEPTYNADGTTAVPGQPVGDPMMRPPMVADPSAEAALPATQGQPAAAPMRVQHQDGRIFEQSPDGNWREVQPVASQPIQQADGSMWQQSPTDGAWRQVPAAVPEQPAREPFAMPPARPLQPGEEDGAATFGPKAPGVQQQPVDTLPMDQTGMQPSQQNVWAEFAAPEQPNSPAPQSLISQDMALAPAHPDFKAPPVSTGKKDAKGFVIMSDGSKVDPRDSAAMKSGGGVTQDVMRMNNPDGSKKEPVSEKGMTLEAAPDFDKLAESADESDRALYGELQNIYSKLVKSPQSPMIQNAISVVVNQQSNPKLAAQAYLYLQSQGIDLSKLSRPKKRQRAGMSGIR